MQNNFTNNCLDITVRRGNSLIGEDKISIAISCDYAYSQRKGKLGVNGEALAKELEECWKSIKTKKLLSMSANFGEQDYYDNMTDIYYTPSVKMERGLRKAKISQHQHGCIPKDWSFEFSCLLADTTTAPPVIEVVKAVMGRHLTDPMEKELTKSLKLFLNKKTTSCTIYGSDS